MLRSALFVGAVFALIAPAPAADPDLSGNWLLSYTTRPEVDTNSSIIGVEVKDGKSTASILAIANKKATPPKIVSFETTGKTVKFKTSAGWVFEGTLAADGKSMVGNYGPEQVAYRAKLTKTDLTEITAPTTVLQAPEPLAEARKLTGAVTRLRFQANTEKDADKKKELTEQADAAQKAADEKLPPLLREVILNHGGTAFAIDAANDLLSNASKYKISSAEALGLISAVEKNAAQFGSRYARTTTLTAVETLAAQKGLEAAAVAAAEKLVKGLTPDTPAAYESRLLTAYKTALEKSDVPNKTETLKTVAASLAKVEEKIDAEYLKSVPPFKPAAYAGRKTASANQVVVLELFTGAQCPPCVAADVAFDALLKAYKPTELVLIQYHLHIPGPDPLTNRDTLERAKYYGANSTPSTFFNGTKAAAGGGAMAAAENKYGQYIGEINPLLEKSTDVKVAGKATRNGDKIDIAVEVRGGDGENMKLRLLLVEETVKYTGSNGLRFHHQVVRAMPGGAEGVAVNDKTFKHTAAVNLADVRTGLTKYLDEYASSRPFPKPDRPMDMKAVRVIALVQNDKTKEIAQALQIEVEGKPATGAGGQ